MSEAKELHDELMRALLSIVPRTTYQNIHRLSRLSWAVIGLCLTHTVRLGAWAEVADQSRQVSCRSGAPLLEARLHHPAIHPQQWYAPFPQVALGDWPPNARVYVALDTTALTPFVLICASLIYRGRAIPLAWRAMQHRSTKVAFEDYQPVLEQVDTKPYDAGQGWAVLVTEKTEANEIGTFKSRSLAPGQGDTP